MKARTRKVQTNKTNFMSDAAFAGLKAVLEVALSFTGRLKGEEQIVLSLDANRSQP